MTLLLTGGTGFVGASVAKRFAADGEDVVTYDISPVTTNLDLVLTPGERERVTPETGDLLDLPRLLHIARHYRVDRIVHLAYMTTAPTAANLALAQTINIQGTNNIFELALAIDAPRVVWASTIDVFGPRSESVDGVVANDAPYDPQTTYGACKLLNEIAAQDYARYYGLDPVALRIPAAFGAGVSRSWVRFVPQLISDLVAGRTGGAPTQTRVMPWLYVEDIAEAFSRAFAAPSTQERGYTLPGTPLGVDRVVELIAEMFTDAIIEPIEWPEIGTVPTYDSQPVQEYLRWSPRYTIEEALHRIADFYRGAVTGAIAA